MSPLDFQLERDAHGRLVCTDAGGTRHEGVVPVRAFPLTAPRDGGLSLVGTDGREHAWMDRIDALPAPIRQLLDEELAAREFMPTIQRIVSVSTYATPSIWQVDTDRGATQLVLKAEEDIRRLGAQRLLITDSHGIVFQVAEMQALDRASRRFLERFL